METRIINQMGEYIQRFDEKLKDILGEAYLDLEQQKHEEVHNVFRNAVLDVISMAKKGKKMHERFVQDVVLNAIDPIIGVDNNDRIFFWNKGAETIFGYPDKEIIGKGIEYLLPDEKQYKEELKKLREETYSEGFVRDNHTIRKTKDGDILSVSISHTLLKDEQNNPLGYIIIIRDMTEMKMLEGRIMQNEKLALIGEIAAGIAHEIGTPLSIITGIAECMLLDREADHPEREDLETVIDQIDRITNLVRDLLAFARPKPLNINRIPLNSEIQRAAAFLKGKFETLNIQLKLELTDNLPEIAADAHQMQQVFVNLFVNACDALSETPGDRRPIIRVSTGLEIQKGMNGIFLVIRFSDNGSGIDKSILPKIFDPFVTTKEVGKGSGLGLAVCKRIIEEHMGSIEGRSVRGEGAEFIIRFPVLSQVEEE